MQDKYISVTQLTRYMKFKLDNDEHLRHVFLKGEISNFKENRGHFYFTIKDETSRINAVMFASLASKLKFYPKDGMKILVTGRISIYEQTGSYQIYVDDMLEDGLGALYIKYEELKKKLSQEGLFDEKYKKKIPRFPNRIGIVTASTGAAVRDILITIKRRWPIVETILFPSLVQGAQAAPEIVSQINRAQDYDLDVLIVGRGGGSIEDLWCFNDENVVRAIFNSNVPIISAVGHEVDFTISDFVADLRAATPTGAAELAVPDRNEIINYLNQVKSRLNNNMNGIILNKKELLNNLLNSYVLKNPMNIYQIKEQQFDILYDKLNMMMNNILIENRNKYNILIKDISKNIDKCFVYNKNRFTNSLNKLEILNPLLTIKRGYSVVRVNDKVKSSISEVEKDDILNIELNDGYIKGKVIDKEKKNG